MGAQVGKGENPATSATSVNKVQPFVEKWNTGRLLGRGAYGDVHEVTTDKGIKCVTKTIRLPAAVGNRQSNVKTEIEKFIQGEENLCNLNHPNIVQFLWVFQKNDNLIVFMEYLNGDTLEDFIDGKALTEDTTSYFSYQILDALHYMHSQTPPVIHRDINSNNIMVLSNDNKIKLIDFGLSVKLQGSHLSASSITPKGTLHFMAPEMLAPNDDDKGACYSMESDIWALGCAVYQMATGTQPHSNCINLLSMTLALHEKGAPLLPESCSENLRDFYRLCASKDRAHRKSAAFLLNHKFLSSSNLKNNFPVHPQELQQPTTERKDPSRDHTSYLVTNPQGICLVIRTHYYDQKSSGNLILSEKDVDRVAVLFNELKFDVEVRHYLTGEAIYRCLRETAEKDHTKYGTFICFLMAHGTENSIKGSDGEIFEIKTLQSFFNWRNCPSLRQKPKLFFIRSFTDEEGYLGEKFVRAELADEESGTFRPNEADFLFVYSKINRGKGYINAETGTPFIQTLCDVIEDKFQTVHFVNILTEVNARVSRQMFHDFLPNISSCLSRRVWLDPEKASKST